MKAIIPIEKIMNTVSSYFYIDEKYLKSESRKKEINKARQVYFYLCGEFTELSATKIGLTVNRDRETYLHGCRKIKIEMEIYPIIKTEVKEIISKLFACNSLIPDDVDLLRLTENYTNSFI